MSGATERETLQELITEAHQAIKDLRGLLREAKKVGEQMVELVQAEQRKQIEEALIPVIQGFTSEFMVKMDEIDRDIHKRYEQVFDQILTQEGEQRRFGETMNDAVLRIIQERGF